MSLPFEEQPSLSLAHSEFPYALSSVLCLKMTPSSGLQISLVRGGTFDGFLEFRSKGD